MLMGIRGIQFRSARRGRPGLRYGGRGEPSHHPPGTPLTYSTNFVLGTPGNTASYKVYVSTTAGNDRGSNPVSVQRPG
jgi:hypothetical protein